jgi:hypothetical protein
MMHAILLATALVAAPAEADCTSPRSAANEIAAYAQTGTLIFSQGDCLAVKDVYQKSLHARGGGRDRGRKALRLRQHERHGRPQAPVGKYCRSECPNTMHVYKPNTKFSKRRQELFVKHLESELGRDYAVKHHLSGKRAEGIHCAEYVMDALAACRLMRADEPAKVSPDSLRQGVEQAGLYDKALVVNLTNPVQKRNRPQLVRPTLDRHQSLHEPMLRATGAVVCL